MLMEKMMLRHAVQMLHISNDWKSTEDYLVWKLASEAILDGDVTNYGDLLIFVLDKLQKKNNAKTG